MPMILEKFNNLTFAEQFNMVYEEEKEKEVYY